MNIALISLYSNISAIGLRYVAACVRQGGHNTRKIFLPMDDKGNEDDRKYFDEFDSTIVEQVIELCRECNLVGISLSTNYFVKAARLTEAVKARLAIPVIWGGIHPTIRPEECLNHADMVCVGEGDNGCITELVGRIEDDDSDACSSTPGIWSKRAEKIIRNPPLPLNQDLDSIPFPDYSLEDSFILSGKHILPMTTDLFYKFNWHGGVKGLQEYLIIGSRGCPRSCSYCINNTLRRMYRGESYVRKRSQESVIREIEAILGQFRLIEEICFLDDDFLARSREEIEDFCEQYKRRIALPFFCFLSPLSTNEEKLSMLVDSGLMSVEFGIQSGSARTKKLFNRNWPNEKILEATGIINKFRDRLTHPLYDVIADIPWEGPEDTLETFELLYKIPRPFHLSVFSLVLYPETELYLRAVQDGYVSDETKQIYERHLHRKGGNYRTLVYYFFRLGLPKPILRFFITPWVYFTLCHPIFSPLFRILFSMVMLSRGVLRRFFRWNIS